MLEVDKDKFFKGLHPAYLNEMKGDLWKAFVSVDFDNPEQIMQFMNRYKITLVGFDPLTDEELLEQVEPYKKDQELLKDMAKTLVRDKTISQKNLNAVNSILKDNSYVQYDFKTYDVKGNKKKILQKKITTIVGPASIAESFMANAVWYLTAEEGEDIFFGMNKCNECREYFFPTKSNQSVCFLKSCRQSYTNKIRRLKRKGIKK